MQAVFRMSAIVAALTVAGSLALTGCGQRGPLYLPVVPPLPNKPVDQVETPPSDVKTDAATASTTASGLKPADELASAPSASQAPSPATSKTRPASGTAADQ